MNKKNFFAICLSILLGLGYTFIMLIFQILRYMPIQSEIIGGLSRIFADIACIMIVLPFLPFLEIAFLSLILMIFMRGRRIICLSIFLAATISFHGIFFVGIYSGTIKGVRLKHTAENAKPLIAAIETYKKVNKKYPEKLSKLVPKFISKIPDTGMCGYSEFSYGNSGNSFRLSVEMSQILIFDEFIYDPANAGEGNPKVTGDWILIED